MGVLYNEDEIDDVTVSKSSKTFSPIQNGSLWQFSVFNVNVSEFSNFMSFMVSCSRRFMTDGTHAILLIFIAALKLLGRECIRILLGNQTAHRQLLQIDSNFNLICDFSQVKNSSWVLLNVLSTPLSHYTNGHAVGPHQENVGELIQLLVKEAGADGGLLLGSFNSQNLEKGKHCRIGINYSQRNPTFFSSAVSKD